MSKDKTETNNDLIETANLIRSGVVPSEEYPFINTEYIDWVNDKVNNPGILFQEGTVLEVGRNGYQVEEVLLICLKRISELNAKFPCWENLSAMTNINNAIRDLVNRTAMRNQRNVEGKHNL